jgi:para-nitrobenzyl esterase
VDPESHDADVTDGPEVGVSAGRLRGTWDDGVAVFRGVPYAEPPVGALRFAAPQPVGGWEGVRPAVTFGPPPPQVNAGPEAGDEWLTVNVWSPALEPAPTLPVMVWVYGGGYTIGASSRAEYDGARLARDGGVVVVTFNYRVGAEGFARLAGAPANRGLLDQVAALEWVRDNVAAFGGDPAGVTVFGESAGGGSVAALLAMPRAAGLFRRAVAQSAQGTYFSEALAGDIAAAIAAELGSSPTAAELAQVEPELLALAGDAVAAKMPERWGPITPRSILFAPVVDGDVLPRTPGEALAGGSGLGIDLLVGHTRDEQRLFTALEGRLGQVTAEQAEAALTLFAPGPGGAGRYRTAYPEAGPEQLYELVQSDWVFRMPTLRLAETQVAAGGRAHVYELTWGAPGMGGVMGACHGLDVPLVFGNLSGTAPAMLLGEGPTPEAETLSAAIRAAWIGFATDGDPGWPAYDPDRRLTRVFDNPSAVMAYPEERSRAIWQDHPFPPLTL